MNEIKKIPYLITISGIIAVGSYVLGYLAGDLMTIFVSFSWAVASDFFDGLIARRLKQETDIGAALDAIRDRLLLTAVVGNLAWLQEFQLAGNLWNWVLAIAAFEILIGLAVLGAYLQIGVKIKSDLVGKVRQAGHITLMGLAILGIYFGSNRLPLSTILQIMTALSFASLVFYSLRVKLAWYDSDLLKLNTKEIIKK